MPIGFRHFFSQSAATQSRSSALSSLLWVIGILSTAIISSAKVTGLSPLTVGLGSVGALMILAYLVAFFYLLFKNPDALRSEHYSLSKMAIERGLVGDSVSGLFENPEREVRSSAPKRLNSPARRRETPDR